MKSARNFESEEKTIDGKFPLASGLFLNFGLLPDPDEDEEARQKILVDTIRQLNKDGDFPPPYMIMDLAELKDIALIVDGEKYTENTDGDGQVVTPSAASNPALKVVMSCIDIVYLKSINEQLGGRSVIKCNAAVPVYRWFQAANLMLKFCDQKGRVIPFPIDQPGEKEGEEPMTTYQMLRVNPREYAEYQKLLEFCVNQNGPEEGFRISAKYAYEVLHQRGISEITAAQVDRTLSHVLLMGNSRIEGVLLYNAGREELDSETLRESHFVFY